MSKANKNEAVCIKFLNGETIICEISSLSEHWVTVKNPYIFTVNPLDDKRIQFVPYLNEFSGDDLFDINISSVVSIFNPHESYSIKYSEFVLNDNKQKLITE